MLVYVWLRFGVTLEFVVGVHECSARCWFHEFLTGVAVTSFRQPIGFSVCRPSHPVGNLMFAFFNLAHGVRLWRCLSFDQTRRPVCESQIAMSVKTTRKTRRLVRGRVSQVFVVLVRVCWCVGVFFQLGFTFVDAFVRFRVACLSSWLCFLGGFVGVRLV